MKWLKSKKVMALGVFLIGAIIAALTINTHQQATSDKLQATGDNPDFKGKWDFIADPKLPNVLIIGDSVSIRYTRPVRERLSGKANVYRPMFDKNPVNCGDTRIGLWMLDEWLGAQKWDVIHFNWGLWDLCYRGPQLRAFGNPGKTSNKLPALLDEYEKTVGDPDKFRGKLSVPLAEYEQNLDKLVTRLRATGATLIWASTTVIPEGDAGRFAGDEIKYNEAAERIMKKHGITTGDLYALTKSFSGKFSEYPNSVHFTVIGSEKIAEQVAETIKRALPTATQ